jgi:signal peptidase I
VLAFLFLVMMGRSSIADHYLVPSGSMEPTLVPGDRVFVDKTAYGVRVPFTSLVVADRDEPVAGDVVIFDSPEDGTRLIKRVVAVAGQSVSLRSGHLSIDGQPLGSPEEMREQFAAGEARLQLEFGGGPDFGPQIVPEAHVLVLGDSRGNSRDSRFFGFVRTGALYARAEGVFHRKGDGFVWLPL